MRGIVSQPSPDLHAPCHPHSAAKRTPSRWAQGHTRRPRELESCRRAASVDARDLTNSRLVAILNTRAALAISYYAPQRHQGSSRRPTNQLLYLNPSWKKRHFTQIYSPPATENPADALRRLRPSERFHGVPWGPYPIYGYVWAVWAFIWCWGDGNMDAIRVPPSWKCIPRSELGKAPKMDDPILWTNTSTEKGMCFVLHCWL